MQQRSKGRSKDQDFIFLLKHHFINASCHHGYGSTGNATLTMAAAEMLGELLPGKHLEPSEEAQISPQVQEKHSKLRSIPGFSHVNSFLQALKSELLHPLPSFPSLKGLDLRFLPKCDSNWIAFGAADVQRAGLRQGHFKTRRD